MTKSHSMLFLQHALAAAWLILQTPTATAAVEVEHTITTAGIRGATASEGSSRWLVDGARNATDDDSIIQAAASSCATLLYLADLNGDAIVDLQEFPFFVQQVVAEDDLLMDIISLDLIGDSYFDLPVELQMVYDDLACYFCGDTDNATMAMMSGARQGNSSAVADEECCVGLYTMIDVDSDIVNGTLSDSFLEGDEEKVEYLQLVCETTAQVTLEAFENITTASPTRPPQRPPPDTEGRIETCPDFGNPGEECSLYMPNLRCSYAHIYAGCTWEDLVCVATLECDCFSQEWMCLSLAMIACDDSTTPTDLPWGQGCDPDVELTRPPAN
ncbi:MAG: hypothetical protein SGARI_006203 [Bacillariaceae sp.]